MTDEDIDARLRAWGSDVRTSMTERAAALAPARPIRSRWIAVAASVAAALVVAAVAGVLVTRSRDATPTVTTRPTQSATSSAPAPATKQVTYRRLAVTVPTSWPINDEHCGSPQHDTIIVPHGTLACLVPAPAGLTWVEFTDASDATGGLRDAHSRAITVSGRPATETTGTITQFEQRGNRTAQVAVPVVRVVVPSTGAAVTVHAPTQAAAQRIADTATVVDRDADGCASQARYAPLVETPRATLTGAADRLVPGTPTSLVVCQYAGDQLAAGAQVPSAQLASALATLQALPAGYVVAGGTTQYGGCTAGLHGAHSLDTFDPEWFVLRADYADGQTLTLHARLGFCGYLGVTNGAYAAGVTADLGELFGVTRVGYSTPNGYRPAR